MSRKGSLKDGACPQHSDDLQAKPVVDVGSAVEDWLDCLWSAEGGAAAAAGLRGGAGGEGGGAGNPRSSRGGPASRRFSEM